MDEEMKELLAQFGHVYLQLESHEMSARHCREQLELLRRKIAELQARTPVQEMPQAS